MGDAVFHYDDIYSEYKGLGHEVIDSHGNVNHFNHLCSDTVLVVKK